MIGETLFKRYSLTSDLDIAEFEEVGLMLFSGLCVGVMLAFLFGDDYFAGVEIALGVLFVECCGDVFL